MFGRRFQPAAAVLTAAASLGLVLAGAAPAAASQDTQAPTAPANLRVVSTTWSTVRLAWDAATDNVGVTLYRVYDGSRFMDYTTGTQLNLWGLPPATSFDLRVYAVDAAGNISDPSDPVPAATLTDTDPPTAPGSFRVTSHSSTVARLAWNQSVDNDGGSGWIDYLVHDGSTTKTVPLTTTTSITGLAPNQVHTFTIRARDRSGNLSEPVTASAFLENVPPTAPSNLRQVGTANGLPVLGWNPATDNSGETIRYSVVTDLLGLVTTTTDLSVRITDLLDDCLIAPGETYVFTVKATDPSGNTSPTSNTLTVTVP